MKLLQSLKDADASPLTCDNTSERALQTLKPRNVLNRDQNECRVGIIEATADERTGNVHGAVQCEVETDVAKCTDVIETRFLKCRDVCIKWESIVKGNAKNPDLIGNLDKCSGDIDSRGNWKRTWVLDSAKLVGGITHAVTRWWVCLRNEKHDGSWRDHFHRVWYSTSSQTYDIHTLQRSPHWKAASGSALIDNERIAWVERPCQAHLWWHWSSGRWTRRQWWQVTQIICKCSL